MTIIGYNLRPITESGGALTSGTGISSVTGHASEDASNTTGSGIDTLLGVSWADIFSISGGPGIVSIIGTLGYILRAVVDPNEDASDAIGIRVQVDGTTIWSSTQTRDAGGDVENSWEPILTFYNATNPVILAIEFEDTFAIQGIRVGTFTDAGSKVTIGEIRYDFY